MTEASHDGTCLPSRDRNGWNTMVRASASMSGAMMSLAA